MSEGPVALVPPQTHSLADATAPVVRGGADGVIGLVGDPERGSLLRELSRAGFTGPYVTQAPIGVSALASDADDTQAALLVGQVAPMTADVPGMRRFRTDMDESPGGASLERTEGAVNNWLAAWVFDRVGGAVAAGGGRVVCAARARCRRESRHGWRHAAAHHHASGRAAAANVQPDRRVQPRLPAATLRSG